MSYIIFDKVFAKYQQYFTMESIKLPEFLNTSEKYNEMVRKTDTVKKYEEVFYELLGDESLPLLDILTLMKCIERDVILLHGINDVTHILELSESFIRYMITMSEEYDKITQTKISRKKNLIPLDPNMVDKSQKHCTYIQYDVSSSKSEAKMTI